MLYPELFKQLEAVRWNMERDIPWETKQVHHIGDEDVAGAETIMNVLPSFLQFAQGSLLVAHNAAFDMGFLTNEK